MKALGSKIWIAGDVHVAYDFIDEGIQTYLVGEGVAHKDIITGQQDARILFAEVKKNQPIEFRWERLMMPWHAHCSDRILQTMIAVNVPSISNRAKNIAKLCQQQDVFQFMENILNNQPNINSQ